MHAVNAQNILNLPLEYRIVAIHAENNSIRSVSNELKLYLPMKLHLPTAFTPNEDGLNDTFGLVGEGVENCRLIIYNRWGEIIFYSITMDQRWDGRHKGKIVPFGSYSYEILAYGKEFGEIHQSGNVTVIR